MSGIKYSQAVLSDTKKEEICRNLLLREVREQSRKLESLASQFEMNHQFKFQSVSTEISNIISGLDKQREKSTKADTTVYDRDLRNFAKDYQNDISQFNQIRESISEIENNISNLEHTLSESRKFSKKRNLLDRALARIHKIMEVRPGDSDYIQENKKSYTQSLDSIRAGLNSWRFELVESAQESENNLKDYKRKFKEILRNFKELKSQNNKKYESVLKVESASEDLKEYLRNAKKEAQPKKTENVSTPNVWKNILHSVNKIKKLNLPDYFPESRQALDSIDIFLKLMQTQKEYAIKSVSERLKVLEGFSRKYKQLAEFSDNQKRNFINLVEQLFKDEKNYTAEEKLELYKIKESLSDLLKSKILKEDDSVNFRTKLNKFTAMVDSRKLQNEEKNFIMETIHFALIEMGYETSDISYPENQATGEIRTLEFRLSSTLKVKILISKNFEFLAQVIYESSDEEVSNTEMEEIRTEIQQWEEDYDKLIGILQKDGVTLDKKWMREIEKDSIIVEYKESSKKNSATKQIRKEL